MRCNRRKNNGDECQCCIRAEESLNKALNAIYEMFHLLADYSPSAAHEWKKLLGDQKNYRRAAKAIGRENLPPLDDLLDDVSQPEEE